MRKIFHLILIDENSNMGKYFIQQNTNHLINCIQNNKDLISRHNAIKKYPIHLKHASQLESMTMEERDSRNILEYSAKNQVKNCLLCSFYDQVSLVKS
jgi:hypothetical protein